MRWLLLLLLFLGGCKKRELLRGEYITRLEHEQRFVPLEQQPLVRSPYPWEERFIASCPRITKEFFRCKGCNTHPVRTVEREGKEPLILRDCPGGHGLPVQDGVEFIYPCLIDLLNYLQERTGSPVVITSGHRCPQHNSYCDPSPKAASSKHLLGAEVSFYMASHPPEELLPLLQEYYKTTPPYKGIKEYEEFVHEGSRYSNKEVAIQMYSKEEGRDFDNGHALPYLSIQVRYDRLKQCRVLFDRTRINTYLRS